MDAKSIFSSQYLSPIEYYLSQNYPNPFNPETKIKFTLSKSALTSLTIYNSLGQIVKELLTEIFPTLQILEEVAIPLTKNTKLFLDF